MNEIYLDTNIFIYLSDEASPNFQTYLSLIEHCQKKKILISTCTETFQEIIHLYKNLRQQEAGIKVAESVFKLVDIVYPVTKETIEIYLSKAKIYKTSSSRDLIHLSVGLQHKLAKIVSADKDFKRFKEIKVLRPDEFLVQT
jgi:predicted nucleic acid-binding protein